MTKYVRPLFIKVYLNGVMVNKVLVDNGAAINIMPSSTLKKINKKNSKLIQTQVIISRFASDKKDTKGSIPIDTMVGSKKSRVAFFIVDVNPSYNALLGRDWIHANKYIPSFVH